MTERSEGISKHSPPGHLSDEGGPVTERSEGTGKHSTLVTSPTKEAP
jgi:hypothetical protein